jgi:hypothetical protein
MQGRDLRTCNGSTRGKKNRRTNLPNVPFDVTAQIVVICVHEIMDHVATIAMRRVLMRSRRRSCARHAVMRCTDMKTPIVTAMKLGNHGREADDHRCNERSGRAVKSPMWAVGG